MYALTRQQSFHLKKNHDLTVPMHTRVTLSLPTHILIRQTNTTNQRIIHFRCAMIVGSQVEANALQGKILNYQWIYT